MTRSKVLVTGASGFIGSALIKHLANSLCYDVIAAVRSESTGLPKGIETRTVGSLNLDTDYSDAFSGVDVVVHSAARVHVMNDSSADPLAIFRLVNVDGTLNLARQAAASGIKRFVFLSSIKVNGEGSEVARAFTSDDIPHPIDPYGISKFEAETGLRKIAKVSGMEVVIIRPVLVYGPGVKANFYTMMSWLNRGFPLPFGSIVNKRSFLYIDNLVDLVVRCLEHPGAANQTFLVSDGQDLSTTELLRKIAYSLGRPAVLLPVPVWLMRIAAIMLRRGSMSNRLFDSLQVDISKTKTQLDWSPPVSADDAIDTTAKHFLRVYKS